MVTILAKDPFELVEDIGDLTFEHVKGHLYFSEVSGEDIVGDKGQGKPKEQCEKSGKEDKERVLHGKPEQREKLEENVKEDKDKVLQGKPKQREKLEENVNDEDNEKVWQLEKEAADAVARAAAAVSDLVADRLPVEETILIVAKASAAVLALVELVGEESEEAERVQRRIGSLHQFSLSSSASKESRESDEREKVKRLHQQDPASLPTIETLPLIKSSKDCSAHSVKKRRQGPAKKELRRRQEEHLLRRSLVDDNPL